MIVAICSCLIGMISTFASNGGVAYTRPATPPAATDAALVVFYSGGWQVLDQRIRTGGSLGNVAEEQFVWSVAYIDGLILRDRNADLNNATGAGGLKERVYALQDALWNTTALVDVNGNVLNRFACTPHGVVERSSASTCVSTERSFIRPSLRGRSFAK
jgi:hypothetical protein